MRYLILCPILLLVGCTTPCGSSSTGWNFSVGKPATLTVPAAITQGSGPLAITPLASTSGPPAIATLAAQDPCTPAARNAGVPVLAARSCTLDEVCQKLDRIEQSLTAPKRLPAGAPE